MYKLPVIEYPCYAQRTLGSPGQTLLEGSRLKEMFARLRKGFCKEAFCEIGLSQWSEISQIVFVYRLI